MASLAASRMSWNVRVGQKRNAGVAAAAGRRSGAKRGFGRRKEAVDTPDSPDDDKKTTAEASSESPAASAAAAAAAEEERLALAQEKADLVAQRVEIQGLLSELQKSRDDLHEELETARAKLAATQEAEREAQKTLAATTATEEAAAGEVGRLQVEAAALAEELAGNKAAAAAAQVTAAEAEAAAERARAQSQAPILPAAVATAAVAGVLAGRLLFGAGVALETAADLAVAPDSGESSPPSLLLGGARRTTAISSSSSSSTADATELAALRAQLEQTSQDAQERIEAAEQTKIGSAVTYGFGGIGFGATLAFLVTSDKSKSTNTGTGTGTGTSKEEGGGGGGDDNDDADGEPDAGESEAAGEAEDAPTAGATPAELREIKAAALAEARAEVAAEEAKKKRDRGGGAGAGAGDEATESLEEELDFLRREVAEVEVAAAIKVAQEVRRREQSGAAEGAWRVWGVDSVEQVAKLQTEVNALKLELQKQLVIASRQSDADATDAEGEN